MINVSSFENLSDCTIDKDMLSEDLSSLEKLLSKNPFFNEIFNYLRILINTIVELFKFKVKTPNRFDSIKLMENSLEELNVCIYFFIKIFFFDYLFNIKLFSLI